MRVRTHFALITIALGTIPVFAQQSNIASLQGRVTDTSGHPIQKVTLLLTGTDALMADRRQPYHAVTGSDGSYSFDPIEPGGYFLEADRVGYVRTVFTAGTAGSGLRLLPGQKMTGADVVMTLTGSVSGTVTDDDGDPIFGVSVRLWRPVPQEDGSRRLFVAVDGLFKPPYLAVTDKSGRYRLENIGPGTYYVNAGDSGGSNPVGDLLNIAGLAVIPLQNRGLPARADQRPESYLTTLYPHALDSSLASQIDVAAGGNLSEIDIRLRKTPLYEVSGKVDSAPPPRRGFPPEQTTLRVFTKVGESTPYSGPPNALRNDGSFQLNGVPPGEYYLVVSDQMRLESGNLLAKQKLDVSDKDIDDVVIHLPPLVELRGTLSFEDASVAPRDVRVRLSAADTPDFLLPSGLSALVRRDGSFTIAGILPGTYRLRLEAQGNPSLKSVRLGGVEMGDAPFSISSGSGTLDAIAGMPKRQ